MKTFEVTIQGSKPILFNNGNQIGSGSRTRKANESFGTPEEQAAKTVYWTPDRGSLCLPSENLHACMKAVSGQYKSGKRSLKPFIAGSIEIAPDHVAFGAKEFKIDTRRCVVQHQGILRCRAKLTEGWKLKFTLLVDDDFPDPSPGKVLQQILEEAGRRIGLGDFRPEKNGKFGKFVVVKFDEVKGR